MYVAYNVSSAVPIIPVLHCMCYLYQPANLYQQILMNVPAVFTIATVQLHVPTLQDRSSAHVPRPTQGMEDLAFLSQQVKSRFRSSKVAVLVTTLSRKHLACSRYKQQGGNKLITQIVIKQLATYLFQFIFALKDFYCVISLDFM